MAFCNVKNPPEYTTEVRKWDRETPADGQGMAVEIEQLFNNTYYNKETKVDKSGGDISGTMVTADEISEKFPVPAAGEETRTFFGKVKKSMEDWKNFKNGIITLGMLSNQYINSTDKIPTSALVYALKQTTEQMSNDITAFDTRISPTSITINNWFEAGFDLSRLVACADNTGITVTGSIITKNNITEDVNIFGFPDYVYGDARFSPHVCAYGGSINGALLYAYAPDPRYFRFRPFTATGIKTEYYINMKIPFITR